jgi:hypothetical protein
MIIIAEIIESAPAHKKRICAQMRINFSIFIFWQILQRRYIRKKKYVVYVLFICIIF